MAARLPPYLSNYSATFSSRSKQSSVILDSRLSHLTVDRRIRRINFVTPTTNAFILLSLITARREHPLLSHHRHRYRPFLERVALETKSQSPSLSSTFRLQGRRKHSAYHLYYQQDPTSPLTSCHRLRPSLEQVLVNDFDSELDRNRPSISV
jgi:hypothetical protein